ncbi:hypothetical protein B5M44_03980 [Shinella sumterensis]|uniref:hypothetical protein n=1 Tax=Shinella sumterensis TaxID=1967501 RepID=UPI00106E22FC|nr:hypothetical protein [Shinella sumterensis]MCD1264098.1 hypothetical protein [Shinella sumterensis]TFE99373.1 hypothetical protein B5M44_03980 [Shinella sumterensis]
MDIFGISTAVKAVVEVYFRGARRTGRTKNLLDTVKKGDTVVFVNREQARLFECLCRENEITDVKTVILPVEDPAAIFNLPMTEGRLIFDHVWLEEHYHREVSLIGNRLDHIATQASGCGSAHRETRRLAVQMARWNP